MEAIYLNRQSRRGGVIRKLVVALLSTVVMGSLLPTLAKAEDRPTQEFTGIKGDAWGFMLFPVLESDIAHLMPEGWTPIACRMRGQDWPLAHGTAQLLLVGKRDHHPDLPGMPPTVTHWTIAVCADPPSEDMLFPGQVHRGITLKSWIDSEEWQRFESRFGLPSDLADIQIAGDIEGHDWEIEVRSLDGTLEFAAAFTITNKQQCVMTGESARLYGVNPDNGEVGAYDLQVARGDLEACYGSRTVVTADLGTTVADILGTTAVPVIAGTEISDNTNVRYTRLRNAAGH